MHFFPNGDTLSVVTCQTVIGGVVFPPTVTCSTPLPSTTTSSSKSGCFPGTETLTLDTGDLVPINKVKVGDNVMVSSKDGKTFFSPVIVIPHPINSDKAKFVQLNTQSGRSIKMTQNHLVMSGSCGNIHSLKEASTVKSGDCVTTVQGEEAITKHTTSYGSGIYTVVTMADEYLVVNGVVVSPFASNHLVTNSFYNIHRVIFKLAPQLVSNSITAKIIKAFGDIVLTITA